MPASRHLRAGQIGAGCFHKSKRTTMMDSGRDFLQINSHAFWGWNVAETSAARGLTNRWCGAALYRENTEPAGSKSEARCSQGRSRLSVGGIHIIKPSRTVNLIQDRAEFNIGAARPRRLAVLCLMRYPPSFKLLRSRCQPLQPS